MLAITRASVTLACGCLSAHRCIAGLSPGPVAVAPTPQGGGRFRTVRSSAAGNRPAHPVRSLAPHSQGSSPALSHRRLTAGCCPPVPSGPVRCVSAVEPTVTRCSRRGTCVSVAPGASPPEGGRMFRRCTCVVVRTGPRGVRSRLRPARPVRAASGTAQSSQCPSRLTKRESQIEFPPKRTCRASSDPRTGALTRRYVGLVTGR